MQWKDLFHPDYEVSDEGVVRNKATGYILKHHTKRCTNKVYMYLKTECYHLSELVYHAFNKVQNLKYDISYYEVFNKDGDITNCKLDNLKLELSHSCIRVFDYEGNMLGDYSSISKFCEEFKNVSSASNIHKALNSGRHTSGLQFRKLRDCLCEYNSYLSTEVLCLPSLVRDTVAMNTPIAKYFKDKIVCVYNNIPEAATANLMSTTDVWAAINRGHKCGVFAFKKIE